MLKCPKCGKLNLGEDKFCEHCLGSLIDLNPQEKYCRWNRVVIKD